MCIFRLNPEPWVGIRTPHASAGRVGPPTGMGGSDFGAPLRAGLGMFANKGGAKPGNHGNHQFADRHRGWGWATGPAGGVPLMALLAPFKTADPPAGQ